MSLQDKVKALLEKEAAAAEEARTREDQAEQAAHQAEALRARVVDAWKPKRASMEKFLASLNEAMKPNSVAVFIRNAGRLDPIYVDGMDIGLTPYWSPGETDQLWLRVSRGGSISASFGTQRRSPVKDYSYDVFDVSDDDLSAIIVDFIDRNTGTERS